MEPYRASVELKREDVNMMAICGERGKGQVRVKHDFEISQKAV
jgi:hypothetical protein